MLTAVLVLVGVPIICCVGVYRDNTRRNERDRAEEALRLAAEQACPAEDEDAYLLTDNPLTNQRPVVELGQPGCLQETYHPSVEIIDPVGDVTDFHSKRYAADILKNDDVVFLFVETRESLKRKQLSNDSCRKYEAVTDAITSTDKKKLEVAQMEAEVEARRQELLSAVERERTSEQNVLQQAAAASPKHSPAPSRAGSTINNPKIGSTKPLSPPVATERRATLNSQKLDDRAPVAAPVAAVVQVQEAAPAQVMVPKGAVVSKSREMDVELEVEGFETVRSTISTASTTSKLGPKKGAHYDKDEKQEINLKVSSLLAKRKQRQAKRGTPRK